MKVAIKNPAPLGPNLQKWGDYHFGSSLQSALEGLGVEVVQHYWPEWSRHDDADVVIVLRGKRRYVSDRDEFRILWVISHPATISVEEIDSYQLAYVASETHQKMLDGTTHCPVRVLRQCTDASLFQSSGSELDTSRRGVVFVANSRGVIRDVVQWGIDAGFPPTVIGRHWKGTLVQPLVRRDYIENDELPALYRAARLSLNDHWGDMVHYGMINNRIFDCLACGLPVLSDCFQELESVCGNGLLYASDPATYEAAILRYTLRYPELLERTRRTWERLKSDYTFDARAEQIVNDIEALPRRRPLMQPDTQPDLEPRVLSMLRMHCPEAANVLHVLPSPEFTRALSSLEGIGYLSAGLGVGPWHVALTSDARQLIPEKFDVLIVEDTEQLTGLSDGIELFNALMRQVRAGGKLIMLASLDALDHFDWSGRFQLADQGSGHVVLARV